MLFRPMYSEAGIKTEHEGLPFTIASAHTVYPAELLLEVPPRPRRFGNYRAEEGIALILVFVVPNGCASGAYDDMLAWVSSRTHRFVTALHSGYSQPVAVKGGAHTTCTDA